MTIAELLAKAPTSEILAMYRELESGIIPTTSACREFTKRVNRMIDQGKLCINPSSYRHVYLPGLTKLLHAEMARRYAWEMNSSFEIPQHVSKTEFKAMLDGVEF